MSVEFITAVQVHIVFSVDICSLLDGYQIARMPYSLLKRKCFVIYQPERL